MREEGEGGGHGPYLYKTESHQSMWHDSASSTSSSSQITTTSSHLTVTYQYLHMDPTAVMFSPSAPSAV